MLILGALELLMKTRNIIYGFLSISSAKYHAKYFLALVILSTMYVVL